MVGQAWSSRSVQETVTVITWQGCNCTDPVEAKCYLPAVSTNGMLTWPWLCISSQPSSDVASHHPLLFICLLGYHILLLVLFIPSIASQTFSLVALLNVTMLQALVLRPLIPIYTLPLGNLFSFLGVQYHLYANESTLTFPVWAHRISTCSLTGNSNKQTPKQTPDLQISRSYPKRSSSSSCQHVILMTPPFKMPASSLLLSFSQPYPVPRNPMASPCTPAKSVCFSPLHPLL